MTSKNKKKIFFLSGKRGGYDAMLPLSKKLSKTKTIDFKIILTDQHNYKNFGKTLKIAQKDFNFKKIVKLDLNQKDSSSKSRLKAMSILINKLTLYLSKNVPDLLILYGDRAESFIAGFVCVNLNIPICHFQGGDLSGNIDEKLRHALTKISDLHFASNYMSKKRILQMGENKKSVFNIGDSHIDSLKKVSFKKNAIYKKYDLQINEDYCVLLFHPDGTSKLKNKEYIDIILKTLESINIKIICVYPCTDIGYEAIIDSLINKSKLNKKFNIFPNIVYSEFLNLIKFSKFFIGNSSSGIIETPYLKKPFVNLGNRQNNRLKSKNIISSKIKQKSILKSIKLALSKKFKKNLKNPNLFYGNGKSYKQAYKKILSNINNIKVEKKFNEIN